MVWYRVLQMTRGFCHPTLTRPGLRRLSVAAPLMDDAGKIVHMEAGAAVIRTSALENIDDSAAATKVNKTMQPGARVVNGNCAGTIVLYRSPFAIIALDDDDTTPEPETRFQARGTARLKTAGLIDDIFSSKDVRWYGQGPSVDEGSLLADDSEVLYFGEGLGQGEIEPIDEHLSVGMACVDLLTPLGKGQSALFVGGKAAFQASSDAALTALQANAGGNMTCIYAKLTGGGGKVPSNAAVVAARDRRTAFGKECEAALTAKAAIAFGDALMREQSKDVLVVLDDLTPLLSLWRRSTALITDEYGAANANLGDDSECRAFFSSILQRCGRKKNGGSLAVLAVACDDSDSDSSSSAKTTEEVEKQVYTVADFEAIGARASVLSRLKLLEDRGIPLDDEILSKIGLRPPYEDGTKFRDVAMNADRPLRSEALEMLTSIADAHVEVTITEDDTIVVDPSTSLQRVGVGADVGADTRPPAFKQLQLGSRLRLDLATAADKKEDAVKADVIAYRRAAAWRAALVFDPSQDPPQKLSDQLTMALLVTNGYLDDLAETDPSLVRPFLRETRSEFLTDPAITTILSSIDATGDLTSTQRKILEARFQELIK